MMHNCYFCYQPVEQGRYHPTCCKRFFGTSSLPELDIHPERLKQLAIVSSEAGITLTGVQPKLSLLLEKTKGKGRLTIVGLLGNYIVKPSSSEFAYLPEVEDVTMHLASIVGIQTAQHALIPTKNGEWAYLTKRFDRNGKQKIHQEDFCQLSELLTEQKYKSSYERLGKLVLKYTTNFGLEAVHYFKLVLFSFLTGNNDMHLKNFAVLHTKKGILLSPAYDLLNVNLIFPEDKEELALTLNGKKANIKRYDFDQLAEKLNMPQKVVHSIYQLFVEKQLEMYHLIAQSFLPKEYQEKYQEIIQSKMRQLDLK